LNQADLPAVKRVSAFIRNRVGVAVEAGREVSGGGGFLGKGKTTSSRWQREPVQARRVDGPSSQPRLQQGQGAGSKPLKEMAK